MQGAAANALFQNLSRTPGYRGKAAVRRGFEYHLRQHYHQILLIHRILKLFHNRAKGFILHGF